MRGLALLVLGLVVVIGLLLIGGALVASCSSDGPELVLTQAPVVQRSSVVQHSPPAGCTHTVQPGENLFRISQRYGTTVDELARLNGLSNPNLIHSGQILRIPCGEEALPAVEPAVAVAAPPTSPPPAVARCGAPCVYTQNGRCYLGNCLDGSRSCGTNWNCGYVPGCSSGRLVACPPEVAAALAAVPTAAPVLPTAPPAVPPTQEPVVVFATPLPPTAVPQAAALPTSAAPLLPSRIRAEGWVGNRRNRIGMGATLGLIVLGLLGSAWLFRQVKSRWARAAISSSSLWCMPSPAPSQPAPARSQPGARPVSQTPSGGLLAGLGTPMGGVGAGRCQSVSDLPEQERREGFIEVGELGRGGFSVVKKVKWPCGLVAALKVVEPPADPDRARRAERAVRNEINALTRLQHPTIPVLYDSWEENGVWCLLLELVKGEELHSLVPLGESEAREVLREVAEAIRYIHQRGFVFADIKTENIIVTAGGRVKLVDWGAAIRLGHSPTFCFYTSGYSPKEQLPQNGGLAGPEWDWHALGVAFYFCLTGDNPVQAVSDPSWRPNLQHPSLSRQARRDIQALLQGREVNL